MEANLLDQLKKATETKLSGDFVTELLKACFTNQKIFDICKQHLKYHYLQSDAQKAVFKAINEHYDVTGKLPTIGIIGQGNADNRDVIALLQQIKKIEIGKDVHEPLLAEFE